MARTKFFRVAVEGPTVDGRTIERNHIQQMAASYDPATYTARINCEHLRGYSPNPPFNAYGSIAEVKTEEVTIKLGGKDVTKLALMASFEVNDQAKELTDADQKIFSSVEIQPNFANTNKAYLVGIALTDSPASLATEALKFSTRDDKRKDHLLGVEDSGFTIEFTDSEPAADEMKQAGSMLKKLFASFIPTSPEPLAPAPAAPAASGDFTQLLSVMEQGFDKLTAASASVAAKQDARIAKLSQDMAKLTDDLEQTPVSTRKYSARPAGTGGGDQILADC